MTRQLRDRLVIKRGHYNIRPRTDLGDEGWELVSITSINFKTGATDHIGMVFKREKQTP